MMESSIDILEIPTTKNFLSMDIMKLYTYDDETKSYKPVNATIADLSSYFYTGESNDELKAKYEELKQLINDFCSFIRINYLKMDEMEQITSSLDYFKKTYDELLNVDTVMTDILEDYASLEYEALKKAEAMRMHEQLAVDYGSGRTPLIGQIPLD